MNGSLSDDALCVEEGPRWDSERLTAAAKPSCLPSTLPFVIRVQNVGLIHTSPNGGFEMPHCFKDIGTGWSHPLVLVSHRRLPNFLFYLTLLKWCFLLLLTESLLVHFGRNPDDNMTRGQDLLGF